MSRFIAGLIAGRTLARAWLQADAARWGQGRGVGAWAAYIAADVDAACARLDACTGDAI